MCGCSTSTKTTAITPERPDVIVVRVEDMSCGHCAARITKAIQAGIPGSAVAADPASRAVEVTGTTDREAVRGLIVGAGYAIPEPLLA